MARGPVEVSTQNIYFHEDSPILSIDFSHGFLATCGCDNIIRLWKCSFSDAAYKENTYKTAHGSSISFQLDKELKGHSRPTNCVRFSDEGHLLASCSDGGKVIVYKDGLSTVIRHNDGDDAYDMCWVNESLVIGFSSGNVEIYNQSPILDDDVKRTKLENNDEEPESTIKFVCVGKQKIHSNTIQGISYNRKYNCIATHSLDRTVKVHLIRDNKFVELSSFERCIDHTRGLFKRLLFEDDLLFVFSKGNQVLVYSYPFTDAHLQMKIGPLASPVVRIIKKANHLCICAMKNVYVIENNKMLYSIASPCFMAITDGLVYNDTIFVSSMDGFITTIRQFAV